MNEQAHANTTNGSSARKVSRLDLIEDEAFIDALDFTFRTETDIAREMLKAGHPASLISIRQRMVEFVNEGAGAIEARGSSWRLAPDIEPTSPPVLVQGDGLDLLRSLPDGTVDLLLADLPYGMTEIGCDPIIDVGEWMAEMHRVVTTRGAIVAFAAGAFTTDLSLAGRAFNRRVEKFEKQRLVWAKAKPTGWPQARARHLIEHEDILIFSKGAVIAKRSARQMIYNPQGAMEVVRKARPPRRMDYLKKVVRGHAKPGTDVLSLTNCPRSILRFDKDGDLHPFQKPVALLNYLIRTYTDEGAIVCDPSLGSGSAGVAALQTGRRFIGAEIDAQMFEIARGRVAEVVSGNGKLTALT